MDKLNNAIEEYESEGYKYIPVEMREFIKQNCDDDDIEIDDYIDDMNNKIEASVADIYLENNEITIYFLKDKSKLIVARFCTMDLLFNILDTIKEYSIYYSKNLEEVKIKMTQLYNKMISDLKNIGYDLIYSQTIDEEFLGWHDIIFKPDEFNQENFIKAVSIINKCNNTLEDLIMEYGLDKGIC